MKNYCTQFLFIASIVIVITLPSPLCAYVGPGAAITMFGALFAVLAAVVFAIGGILFWPIRSLLRKIREKKQRNNNMITETQQKK